MLIYSLYLATGKRFKPYRPSMNPLANEIAKNVVQLMVLSYRASACW